MFSNEQERYLMLDEEDFKCLVRGGVLQWGNIKLALKDIGFDRMHMAVMSAEAGIDLGIPHNRKG